MPRCSGVYFVISEIDQILYIGSSSDISSRWDAHHRALELNTFGSIRVAWLQVSDISSLTILEGQAIRDYKPILNIRRVKGDGTGYVEFRPIVRNGKEYPQYWYHYEFWSNGKYVTKTCKYIPKRLLKQVLILNEEKAPVAEILKLLGVD